MAETSTLRDFIYLDTDRVRSLAAQLGTAEASGEDRASAERVFMVTESALVSRGKTLRLDPSFDFNKWTEEGFTDGQVVLAGGVVRLLDFTWLAAALGGLPAV